MKKLIFSGALAMYMAGTLGQSIGAAHISPNTYMKRYVPLVSTDDFSNTGMVEISAENAARLIGKSPRITFIGAVVPELNANSVRIYQINKAGHKRKNVIEILQFGIEAAIPKYFLDESN
ncbi:hypothetical protein VLK31_16075 [Variovorax sp. H27-G14]